MTAFPAPGSPLDLRLELNAGGTWTDVSADLDHGPVTIGRGHPDESTTVAPSTISAQLTNTAARYSPDNPMSDLWPWCTQNMPGRVSIPAASDYLRLEASGGYATAADNANLHVTGSLELRLALRLSDWRGCVLAHRWDIGSCWAWLLNGDGTMTFFWEDASVAQHVVVSATPLPNISGDFALKMTLDVTTGTVTYYTAPSIDGTYTAVEAGASGTGGAATSLRSTSAAVSVGYEALGIFTQGQLYGRVYEFRLYSGIGGTLKADAVFTGQAAGATSWTDAQGNSWSLTSPAEISARDYRLHFECSELPQQEPEYNPDAANNASVPVDAVVPLVGGGLLRRLSQRAPDVQSPVYRAVLAQTAAAAPVAYWPMEDASGAASFGSATGGPAMTWTGGPPVLASASVVPGSASLPVLGGASLSGAVPAYTTGGGAAWTVSWISDIGTLPGSSQVLMQVGVTGGIAAYVCMIVNSTGTVTLTAYAADGVTVVATTGPMLWLTSVQIPLLWSMTAQPSGANVQFALASVATGAGLAGFGNVFTGGTGAAGYVTSAAVNPAAGNFSDTALGHVQVQPEVINAFTLSQPIQAWPGEASGTRFARLCAENGIPCRTRGNLADTVTMGVQPSGTLTALLQACADADQGVWTELRQQLGWGFITRRALYNQAAAVTLDYKKDHLSPWSMPPTRDDQVIVNDVTFSNDNGASVRVFAAPGQPVTGGRMSTANPGSGGVGTYALPFSVSSFSDARLPDLAMWKLHLGTTDQARLPGIMADLANTDATLPWQALVDLDLGDRLVISNPPRRLGFEPVTQLAQGLAETLWHDTLAIGVAGVPELPYQVWTTASRVESAGTTLHANQASGSTSWQVDVTGPLWSTAAGDYPLSWVVDGERVTVTAMSGGSSPQTATVTRSANGVVKSHLAGAAVTLWPPPVIGL